MSAEESSQARVIKPPLVAARFQRDKATPCKLNRPEIGGSVRFLPVMPRSRHVAIPPSLKAHASLASGAQDKAHLNSVAELAMSEIMPIDDMRSTAAYRRRVTGNLLMRHCGALFSREAGRGDG